MSEVVKDYAIKLFGKTIDVHPYMLVSEQTQIQSPSAISTSEDLSSECTRSRHDENESTNPTEEETLTEATTSSSISPSKEEEPSESSGSEEKTVLKKPDKLIPCPRCESLDTKFCYFNNYNVNQPRYFCRSCQRYWTSGGTMRNVPIGSGRRKNKNRDDVINSGNQLSSFKYPNGFLVFGQDESMNPTLNLVQRPQEYCGPNDVYKGSISPPVNFYPTMPHWGPVPLFSTTTTTALGKRSREGTIGSSNSGNDQNPRRRVLIPKTLRIDDPNEAAKSSIWSTLGIKNERIGSVNGACLFKALEPKAQHGLRNMDSSTMLLRANPAALSRSLNFNETA